MKKIILLLLGALFLSANQSHAEIIGTYQYHRIKAPIYTPYRTSTNLEWWIGPYGNPIIVDGAVIAGEPIGDGYYPDFGPLFDIPLTIDDDGTTFIVNSGVAFDVAVEALTNGIRDSMFFE